MHGILLAAGASRRLGQAKQLLTIQDKTLLEWSCLALLQTCDQVTVLLGAETEGCCAIVHRLQSEYTNLDYLICSSWDLGMGSTLSEGLNTIGDRDDVCIHLVDLPFINGFHLKFLINQFKHDASKAWVSSYKGLLAPPIIIPRALIEQFYQWKGETGLGVFWKNHPELVHEVELGTPYQDIDTPEDWKQVQEKF